MWHVYETAADVLFTVRSAVVITLVTVLIWWSSSRKSRFPPGPTGLPLVGYLPFLGKFPPQCLTLLREKFGTIFSITLGTKQYVVLSKYDVIHEALVKRGSVFSGRVTPEHLEIFGSHKGIIYRDYGESWKRLRKFGMSTLKGFGVGKRSMEERVNEEIGYLLEEIRAKQGESFDILKNLSHAAANVIGSIVNGRRYDHDDYALTRLLTLLSSRYGGKDITDRINAFNHLPMLRYFPGFRTAYKVIEDHISYSRDVFGELIKEHKDTYDSNDVRDFIDAFLKEMDEDQENHFTPEILAVIIRDLFNAGTETTSTTLRWCFLYLTSHQELQDRLRDEIKIIGTSGPISMESRTKMPLTCSFIHEIQRAKSIVPIVTHKITEDVVFRGFSLPKNTGVLVNLWHVHHDPEIFANPNQFWPGRFLDADGNFAKHDRVIPYSVGPRYCLGIHLAEMEVFMFLIGILRNFRLVEDIQNPLPPFEEGVAGLVYSPPPYRAKFLLTD